MDKNFDKIGINQKNKKNIKDATSKTNIHKNLLNILKTYNANVHQGKPRSANTDGTDRLQLSLDTRQGLGKRPAYDDPDHVQPHTHTSSSKKRAAGRVPPPPGSAYPSLIPQVDYTDGPTPVNPTKPPRTLLVIPK
jgi:hypothetical protein